MTVGQLLDSISAAELAEWTAYFRLKNEETKKAKISQEAEQALARARRLPRRYR